MLAAARAMRGRAEAALGDLAKAPPPHGKADAASRLKGLAAEADSVVSFGESLWNPDATGEIREKVENSLRRGIAAYYQLGQLLAMPALLEQPEISATAVAGASLPLPGQPGFDPWCLTDPASRSVWQQDPAARRAIDMLWRYDPDPAATVGIQAQIDAAAAAGSPPRRWPRAASSSGACCLARFIPPTRWTTATPPPTSRPASSAVPDASPPPAGCVKSPTVVPST